MDKGTVILATAVQLLIVEREGGMAGGTVILATDDGRTRGWHG